MDWTPEVLPFAPRPINGELLSSWARRLAAANGVTLREIAGCVGDLLGAGEGAMVFDYAAPKPWRLALARMTRIPERWVWVLDLQQHFPVLGREGFLHDPVRPQQIISGFCPECFAEQVAARRTLHLKAEWALTLVTRCLRHELPLYRNCPWCGQDQPVHFPSQAAVQCLYCEQALTIRRLFRTPVRRDPFITAFERAVVEALGGKTPDAAWAGEMSGRAFRALLIDIIWMLTTPELIGGGSRCALADHITPPALRSEETYGDDFEVPFCRRSWRNREIVVAGMIQVLRGAAADGPLDLHRDSSNPAEFRPFVEVLRWVQRNECRLRARIRRWPGPFQDRARGARRLLESRRQPSTVPDRQKAGLPPANPGGRNSSSRSAGRAGSGR